MKAQVKRKGNKYVVKIKRKKNEDLKDTLKDLVKVLKKRKRKPVAKKPKATTITPIKSETTIARPATLQDFQNYDIRNRQLQLEKEKEERLKKEQEHKLKEDEKDRELKRQFLLDTEMKDKQKELIKYYEVYNKYLQDIDIYREQFKEKETKLKEIQNNIIQEQLLLENKEKELRLLTDSETTKREDLNQLEKEINNQLAKINDLQKVNADLEIDKSKLEIEMNKQKDQINDVILKYIKSLILTDTIEDNIDLIKKINPGYTSPKKSLRTGPTPHVKATFLNILNDYLTDPTAYDIIKKHYGIDIDVGAGLMKDRYRGDGIYSDEITEWMDKFKSKGFKGVYGDSSLDDISSIPLSENDKSFSFIILHNHHWTSCFVTPDTIEYFDSFGEDPSSEVLDEIKKVVHKWKPGNTFQIKINNVKRQNVNSTNCGYFAMKFLVDRYKGKTFKEATGWKIIEDSKHGEGVIKEFKKRIGEFKHIKLDDETNGSGPLQWLYSKIKHLFNGKYAGEKSLEKLLKEHGNAEIKEITVYREPIQKTLKDIANVISIGEFKKKADELGYDNFFHLYCVIVLSDGFSFRYEKNQNPNFIYNVSNSREGDYMDVPNVNNKHLKLVDAVDKQIKQMGEYDFFVYDALKNNCQTFINMFLKANGLLTDKLKSYIVQDTVSIAKSVPWYSKLLINVVTDLGAAKEKLQGNGAFGGMDDRERRNRNNPLYDEYFRRLETFLEYHKNQDYKNFIESIAPFRAQLIRDGVPIPRNQTAKRGPY